MTDHRIKLITPVFAAVVLFFASIPRPAAAGDEAVWKKTRENAASAQNAFVHSHRFVIGWLAHADPESGLIPRHREYLNLPTDYPRLNQFPEWFTVDPAAAYRVKIDGQDEATEVSGKKLAEGISLKVERDQSLRITIRPVKQ